MKVHRSLGLLSLVAILLMFSIPPASAYTLGNTNLQIISAYYTDCDGDGFNDDIRIVTFLELNVFYIEDTLDWYLYMYIYLPSGNAYLIKGHFVTSAVDQYLIFDALNTVTEQGWYVVSAHAYFNDYLNSFSTSVLAFDPPKKGGNGAPSVIVQAIPA